MISPGLFRSSLAVSVGLLVACRGTSPPPPAGSTGSTSAVSSASSTGPLVVGPIPANSTAPTATAAPSASASAVPASSWRYGFDTDAAEAPPAGFSFGHTGEGKPGVWIVRADKDAQSAPNVLAQTLADPSDGRFAIAVAPSPPTADVRVAVRCRPVSGAVDQACGLVFRYQDEKNYLLARANALENNVRLYFVKDGRRQQIASHNGPVTSGAWHSLAAEVLGSHIEVTWDGAKVLAHDDATFTAAGRAGVWTKADSITYFDDLVVERL